MIPLKNTTLYYYPWVLGYSAYNIMEKHDLTNWNLQYNFQSAHLIHSSGHGSYGSLKGKGAIAKHLRCVFH